jgi:hypothetical protein
MPRTALPFSSPDISALARSIRSQLAAATAPPGHLQLLNMLARATGHRNYQHWRARAAESGLAAPAVIGPDAELVEAASRHFDTEGRLLRWPARKGHQQLALWALWSAFPPRREMPEREVNARIRKRHGFGDHALLRRALFAAGLLFRTRDGSVYRRIEREPPPEAIALIRRIKSREA